MANKKRKKQKILDKKQFNNESGITLIALVITIIVLLILAGVTIAMLTGNNGILTKVKEAKEKTKQAEREEKYDLDSIEEEIEKNINQKIVEQVTDKNPGELEKEEENVFVINSIEDLIFFAYDVREGNTYEGKTVKLGIDLDFNSTKSYVNAFRMDYGKYGYDGELKTLLTSGEGFLPIGTINDVNISNNYFKGTFDGNYHEILNLYQSLENSDNVTIAGLFGTNGGIVEKIKVTQLNIYLKTNNMHILYGSIAGRNSGEIRECSTSGKIYVDDNGIKSSYIGGISGQSSGKIEKSTSGTNIKLDAKNISGVNIGGISGSQSNQDVQYCYNTGKIEVKINNKTGNEVNCGGITGYNIIRIQNCYNAGTVYVDVDETERILNIGNIVGLSNQAADVSYCYNVSDMRINLINNDTAFIGNIIGKCYKGTISYCYNTGTIDSNNFSNERMAQIIPHPISATVSNCYGIANTINLISDYGVSSVENIIAVEKDEMKNILEVMGENFKADSNNINDGYPLLKWQE